MSTHIVDSLSLGTIVQIRERLLKAAASGAKVFRLESGDPSFSIAPHVADAICVAAQSGKTHYVPNAGIPELRAELARKLRTVNGIPVESPEDVFVTHGAMHALFAVFQVLLEEGDEVILPDPMWTEIAENVQFARGRVVRVPLQRSTGYEYSPAEIERRITPRTKAIFVNTPHNPTGAVLSPKVLGEIVDLARSHNLWVVSDEAYEDVVYTPHRHHSIASLAGDWADRVLSIFSFSKSHAMSGLRVGALVVQNPLLKQRLQKVLRCSINGVSSLAQWGALAALQGPSANRCAHQEEMLKEYSLRRDLMVAALTDIPGVHPFTPGGTFFAWAEFERSFLEKHAIMSVDALSDILCSHGVGNTPGSAFGPESGNAMRFSFSCDTEMVKEGVGVLRAVLLGDLRLT